MNLRASGDEGGWYKDERITNEGVLEQNGPHEPSVEHATDFFL